MAHLTLFGPESDTTGGVFLSMLLSIWELWLIGAISRPEVNPGHQLVRQDYVVVDPVSSGNGSTGGVSLVSSVRMMSLMSVVQSIRCRVMSGHDQTEYMYFPHDHDLTILSIHLKNAKSTGLSWWQGCQSCPQMEQMWEFLRSVLSTFWLNSSHLISFLETSLIFF